MALFFECMPLCVRRNPLTPPTLLEMAIYQQLNRHVQMVGRFRSHFDKLSLALPITISRIDKTWI
jgi:hypothetical protein